MFRNVAWGAAWGVFCGAVYLAFAAMVIALKGGFPEAPPGVTPITLLGLYTIGGLQFHPAYFCDGCNSGQQVSRIQPPRWLLSRAQVPAVIARHKRVTAFSLFPASEVASQEWRLA